MRLPAAKPEAPEAQPDAETLLVGYGTLLYRGSLGQSIGATLAESKPVLPVVVRDYKRLFNVRAEHYESSHKVSADSARLNEHPAAEQFSCF